MKDFYDKKDIQNYETDKIPLDTTVIIRTKWDTYKGKLIINNKDCIAIDYPKELKGTHLSRAGIESIRVVRNLFNISKKENNHITYELGDIVEIDNIDSLNPECLYSNTIGLQGNVVVIDKGSSKNNIFYTVDLPIVKQHRYIGIDCITSGQLIFTEKNLKLIKKGNDEMENSKFFNPSDIKTLNYKDLDGKTLKMTVVDNDECLLVVGIDKETNTIYMLRSEVK